MSDTRHLPRPPFAAHKSGDFASLMAMRRNPLEMWGEAAYREGVLEGSFLGRQHFLVSDPEAIHRVLVANVGNYVRDTASRRIMFPVFGEGLFLAEGDSWRRQRRMIAPAMTPRALTLLARHVALESEITEQALAAGVGHEVELLPVMQELALGIAGRSMFSLEMGQRGPELRRLLVHFRETLSAPTASDLLLRPETELSPADRRRIAFRVEWTGFIDALIAERDPAAVRPEGAPRDLLDMLSDARDGETGEALDAATLRDEVATMILAGHETTAVTLFWACFLFARFPAWQEELAAEAAPLDLSVEGAAAAIPSLARLRRHVDETLRLYPPAFVITREALGPDELGGQTIPAGAMITISPFVVNRHEQHWDDPDAFDPGRFAGNPPARYTYLPFGAGPRVCIGATFALTEVVVVLGRLLQRFRVDFAPGHSEVLPRGSVTTHPDRTVMFVLHRRQGGEGSG